MSAGSVFNMLKASAVFYPFFNFRSKAGSANLGTQNLIHPRMAKVPGKDKLYNEIENPHFVPPPKPIQAEYNQPDPRSVTPPGTVQTE